MDYMDRNRRWLSPIIGGVLVAAGPALFTAAHIPLSLPEWVTTAGVAIAGLAAGVGATLTDTISARLVRFLGTATGAAAILYGLLK